MQTWRLPFDQAVWWVHYVGAIGAKAIRDNSQVCRDLETDGLVANVHIATTNTPALTVHNSTVHGECSIYHERISWPHRLNPLLVIQ